MWQAPSMHAASSSYSNETAETSEGIVSLNASEDHAESRISPNPLTACTLGIPVSEYQYEMSSNIRSQRQRGHRRRTYDRRQRHQQPCRMTNLNTLRNMPSRHCNRQDLDQQSNSRDTQEESSLRVLTKRSGGNQYIGDLYENQQETENDAPTPDDAERGLLVRSSTSHDSRSFETLTPSLLQLGSPCIQSISPVSQIENSSVNELGLEQESELPLIPLIRVDNTCEEPFELNTKRVSPSQGQYALKPLLNFDDPFFSPARMFPEFPTPSANARKLANNLIKLSRYLKAPNITELCCLDCGYVPVLPVTGQCGHTRCMRCIIDNGDCPCSANAPKTLLVNTVVRQIIEKMMRYITRPRTIEPGLSARDDNTIPQLGVEPRHLIKRRDSRYLRLSPVANSTHCLCRPRMPMTVQARYRRARHFLAAGKYLEAASHLARVAASSEPIARNARILLAQTITAMWCKRRRRGSISRRLRQSVREQAAHSWLKPSDLECVLCTDTYSSPVCTPCGHTYCRECIERSLYFQKKCALCLSSLENFNLDETRDTVFITSILSSIDVIPSRGDTDVIPVVTCHVAYPGMPCPLFVFNPRYCLMVQRVLESGSRRFGMLAYNFASYGTVLEIRDCILFEDSRCIVSTVGVSRFRVVERFDEDGCDVARIRSLSDINLIRLECRELHLLAVQVYSKAVCWLHSMDVRTKSVLDEIQTAFGSLPYDVNPEELETSDGPYWLWWLVAILPLNREIKFLILSTRSLLKRMLAVSRALDLVDSDPTSHASSGVPVNSEEWLPSNS